MQEKSPIFNAEPIKESAALDISSVEDSSLIAIPDKSDPNWSDYVISQLEPDEIYNGLPTTDGMRRIIGKLIGSVIESVPIVVQCPTPQNDNHATVAWRLVVRTDNNEVLTYGDVADVYSGNTPQKEFSVHATATAATKAEGRALRKALHLKRIIAAEEMSEMPPEDPNRIREDQIVFIDMLCKRNDVNVMKLLAKGKEEKVIRIEDLSYSTACRLCRYLDTCQRGRDDNGKEIKFPDGVQGYDPNWRQNESSI